VGAVKTVLEYIDVQLPGDWSPRARMIRQSDGLNAAWYEAYQRDALTQVGR
jgi:hypothetical protein